MGQKTPNQKTGTNQNTLLILMLPSPMTGMMKWTANGNHHKLTTQNTRENGNQSKLTTQTTREHGFTQKSITQTMKKTDEEAKNSEPEDDEDDEEFDDEDEDDKEDA